jgi:hypothetical protein
MPLPDQNNPPGPTAAIERQVALVFAPLDKRALGMALGVTLAMVILLITGLSAVLDPNEQFPVHLLDRFFFGYSRTLTGAMAGAFWGFVTGFCWGWFLAFARNFALAVWLMIMRVRDDVASSRVFLDHI